MTVSQAAVRRQPKRRWWIAVAVLVTVVAATTRLPGAVRPWFDRDEAHIAVQAQTLLRGDRLYEDVIDRKPPLVPAIYAAVNEVVQSYDLRPIRVLLAIWVAAAALVIAAITLRLGGSRRSAVIAALLYVLGTVAFAPRDGQSANFELWAVLPAAGAVFFALDRSTGRRRFQSLALAGALVGVAACVKQPFALTIVPVLVAAARGPSPGTSSVAVTVGAAAAIAGIGAIFGLSGMIRWAWTENGDYLAGEPLGLRTLGIAALMSAGFLVLHAPAAWLATRLPIRRYPGAGIIVVWLVASALPVAIGLRFLGHYYQQLLPPICALAGLGALHVTPRARNVILGSMAALATVAVILSASPLAPRPMPVAGIARFIEETTNDDDAVLVWGPYPDINWVTNRPIAGGFVHHGFLTAMWTDTDADRVGEGSEPALRRRWRQFLDDLRRDRPKLVIDTSTKARGAFRRYPPDAFPLGDFLRERYEPVGYIQGMRVWRWVETPADA